MERAAHINRLIPNGQLIADISRLVRHSRKDGFIDRAEPKRKALAVGSLTGMPLLNTVAP